MSTLRELLQAREDKTKPIWVRHNNDCNISLCISDAHDDGINPDNGWDIAEIPNKRIRVYAFIDYSNTYPHVRESVKLVYFYTPYPKQDNLIRAKQLDKWEDEV